MDQKKLYFMAFPGGKRKALTLSYDDGVVQDRRLVGILNDHGLKATFNLGAGVLGFHGTAQMNGRQVDISKVEPEEVKSLYAGHEVAGHGLWHSDLTGIGTPAAMYEIIEDRRQLEALTGRMVHTFAYPFGTYNDEVKRLLAQAGYDGARTVVSTGGFAVPGDFLAWNPTCHHSDPSLTQLCGRFCHETPRFPAPQLFYLWGHAYEFDAEDNWHVLERFADSVAPMADEIWFATNGEISRYVHAYRSLRFSADGATVYNPTAAAVWMGTMEGIVEIAPGGEAAVFDKA